jgi:hypothetical protein
VCGLAVRPASNTLWNPDCLDEVSRFVRETTAQHRIEAKLSKPGKAVDKRSAEGLETLDTFRCNVPN